MNQATTQPGFDNLSSPYRRRVMNKLLVAAVIASAIATFLAPQLARPRLRCRLAHIEARDLYRGTAKETEKEEHALRKIIFACAGTGPLGFDTLCGSVWAIPSCLVIHQLTVSDLRARPACDGAP